MIDIQKNIHRFFQLFNKNNGRYNNLGYYYYECLANRYNNERSYLTFISDLESQSPLFTENEISLSAPKIFSETNIKYILKNYGKPHFRVTQKQDVFEVEILFYRIFIGKYKTKLELHFYNDQLFFFCYTFSYLKEENTQEIISIMQEKYLEGKPIDTKTNYIIDRHESIIQFCHDVDFTLNYISTRNKIFLDLQERHDFIKNKSESQRLRNREVLKDKL